MCIGQGSTGTTLEKLIMNNSIIRRDRLTKRGIEIIHSNKLETIDVVEKMLEWTIVGIVGLDISNKTLSGKTFPGGSNCKRKLYWISEQVKVPRCKSIVAYISKRVDKFKILRKEISSLNANNKLRGTLSWTR